MIERCTAASSVRAALLLHIADETLKILWKMFGEVLTWLSKSLWPCELFSPIRMQYLLLVT